VVNVIFTSYFTKKLGFSQHDSSHGGKGGSQPDDYKLMKNWYETTCKVLSPHTHAVIFHNECSEKFCQKYSNEFLTFVRWEKEHRPSYNDERFYAFREYLTLHPEITNAISTDMFDVQILRNPFDLFFHQPDYDIYCGSEKKNVAGSFGRKWVNNKMKKYKLGAIPNEDGVYNAGICGGNRDLLIRFYDIMVDLFKKISPKENANMAVFNKALRMVKETGGWRVFTGHPLHNVFESNKVQPDTYIKHK